MANIHTPERLNGESFEDYKKRRSMGFVPGADEIVTHNKQPRGGFKRNQRAALKKRNVKRHRAACR